MGFSHRGLALNVPHWSGGGDAYWQRMLNAQPANLIQLLRKDEAVGATAEDSSVNNHDGAYVNVTLAGYVGPDGANAPLFDPDVGNIYVDAYSAGFANAFDGAELTIMIWLRVTDASVWTDVARTAVFFRADSSNYIELTLRGDGPNLMVRRVGSGTSSQIITGAQSGVGWRCLQVTISETADEMKLFINGVQEGATATGLGAWVGPPASTVSTLGARNQIGTQEWAGGLALEGVWNAALSDSKIASLGSI